jgi:hypothetical protein
LTYANRLALIRQIQKARKSTVITYITSTKPNLEVQMAMDAVRRFYDHLTEKPQIDLFIHSNGGDGTVPWRLVTLIREFTDKFNVLVPHRAFSAATLTALGADKIVMHPMGMLGPTDPTVTNPFNPPDPTNPQRRVGISVEDVTAYIALIKEDAGIQHEDELVQAFLKLAEHVHPLALGNVKRSLSQSRMMARKLLSLHMDSAKDEHKIDEIVDNLTSKLFYHGHPINRVEAQKQVGMANIEWPTAAVEKAMWRLYLDYEQETKMETRFDFPSEFVAEFPTMNAGEKNITSPKELSIAYIESDTQSDTMRLQYEISGTKNADGSTAASLIVRKQGWHTEKP